VDQDDYQIEILLLKDGDIEVATVSVLIMSKYIPNNMSKEGIWEFIYQSVNQSFLELIRKVYNVSSP
jgi:hypothetical protein